MRLKLLLLCAGCLFAWFYYDHLLKLRKVNPDFAIRVIVQTGPECEALPSYYLAELLDLSIDKPTNIYNFTIERAEKKLLSTPVIKEAKIATYTPNTLYIDYTVRHPIAYLGDYSNLLVDEEGALFPCQPLFTPKKLPELYLGLAQQADPKLLWQSRLTTEPFKLACQVLQVASEMDIGRIIKIDVCRAEAKSCGQRQIILSLEESYYTGQTTYYLPRTLRLPTKNFAEALANYSLLRKYLLQQLSPSDQPIVREPCRVIDLRIAHLAYF